MWHFKCVWGGGIIKFGLATEVAAWKFAQKWEHKMNLPSRSVFLGFPSQVKSSVGDKVGRKRQSILDSCLWGQFLLTFCFSLAVKHHISLTVSMCLLWLMALSVVCHLGVITVCFVLTWPPGAEGLRVEFDRQCSTERRHDPLTVMDGVNRIVSVRSGVKGGWTGHYLPTFIDQN